MADTKWFTSTKIHDVTGIKNKLTLHDNEATKESSDDVRSKTSEAVRTDSAEKITWRSEWRNFADYVALSGVKFIVDKDLPTVRRVLWAILVCVGAGLMTYQLAERIGHYYSYPKSTVLEMDYPTKLSFPAITVCNENRITQSGAASLGLWYMYKTLYWPYSHPATPEPAPGWFELDAFYKQHMKNQTNWRKIEEIMAPDVLESIFWCQFNNQGCSALNVTFSFTEMGRCYTFNKDQLWSSSQAGARNGLTLILGVMQGNYHAALSPFAGFRILPHSPNEHPDILNRGILLSPGSGVNLEVHQVQNFLLGPPYGKCNPNKKLVHIPRYTVSGCLYECRHLYMRSECNCIHVGFSDYARNSTVCDPREEHECLLPATEKFFKEGLAEELCDCPPACTTATYSYTYSKAVFSNMFVNAVVDAYTNSSYPFDQEFFVKNNLIVNVYFPTVSQTKVSEKKAYDVFSLFCDMGGALGLLLGSTFLTVYEFVDFFVFTALRLKHQ